MYLSLSWLREFVPYTGSIEELAHDLTMLGLEVEGITHPYKHLEDLVVGQILECEKHPNADTLSVCKVDVGNEVLDIVCGAPNVALDQKVVVIKVGSFLMDGTEIKAAELRGEPSHGMICSERELGLSDEHDGIIVLDESAKPGTPALEALPLDQVVFDISITPNRGDCLSVLGIAREVAMAYNLPLKMPEVALEEIADKAADLIKVEIENPEKCPLYYGRILEGIKNKPSPKWLRYRLNACGIRSISAIVDITNYIMLELGQPMHSFDLDKVTGDKIIVRSATAEEKLETLDDETRDLLPEDIVIADEKQGLALGGVMGGLHSEVTEESTRVLLEGAVFLPSQVRRTGRRLNLSSESSFRFERGVDQSGTAFALDRAAYLMAKVTGAKVLSGYAGLEAKKAEKIEIDFSSAKASELIGVELTNKFCRQSLENLGCEIKETKPWKVYPPIARTDLKREADLIEEVARIYGVDKIPAIIPAISRPLERAGLPETKQSFLKRIKHWAAGHAALNEAVNYSFTASKLMDQMGISQEGRIYLANPLSEDLNVLRTHLAPGLLTSLGVSVDHEAAGVRIFEVASVFHKDQDVDTGARESSRLAIALTGARSTALWSDLKGDMGYEDLKGIIELLASYLGLKNLSFELSETLPYLLPCVEIKASEKIIGFAGRVEPKISDYFNAKKDIWYAELDLETLYHMNQEHKVSFKELPQFPPVRRDITFIAPTGFKSVKVLEAVTDLNISIMEDMALIDSFKPEAKDEVNLTYRLTFRNPERTLKDKEADKERDKIAKKICNDLSLKV